MLKVKMKDKFVKIVGKIPLYASIKLKANLIKKNSFKSNSNTFNEILLVRNYI
jgi:hypothetical protein